MDTKICEICKEVIQPTDNYVRLTDYKAGEQFTECFYHTLCYTDQIRGLNPQQKLAMGMLKQTKQLLDKVQGKPQEVYQV